MTRQTVRPEVRRTRSATGFTRLLSRFLKRHRALHCVCLVDAEGECIDDASRISGDESALIGATFCALRPLLDEHAQLLGGGAHFWTVDCAQHAFGIRRASAELTVVVAGGVGALDRRVVEELHALCEALRHEAGAELEPGDPWGQTVTVEVRASRRWGYAPVRYVERERSVGPLVVLGRFGESWAGVMRHCFLIREEGGERTLCHDTELNRWFLR